MSTLQEIPTEELLRIVGNKKPKASGFSAYSDEELKIISGGISEDTSNPAITFENLTRSPFQRPAPPMIQPPDITAGTDESKWTTTGQTFEAAPQRMVPAAISEGKPVTQVEGIPTQVDEGPGPSWLPTEPSRLTTAPKLGLEAGSVPLVPSEAISPFITDVIRGGRPTTPGGMAEKITSGLGKGTSDVLSSLSTSTNLGMLLGMGSIPAGVIKKVIELGFSADMLGSLVDTVPQFVDAVKAGDVENAIRIGVNALATTAMGGAALKGGLSPIKALGTAPGKVPEPTEARPGWGEPTEIDMWKVPPEAPKPEIPTVPEAKGPSLLIRDIPDKPKFYQRLFPNTAIEESGNGHLINFKDGRKLWINQVGRILINEEQFTKQEGRPPTPEDVATGSWRVADNLNDIIELLKEYADTQSLGHELFHRARQLALTPTENHKLDIYYGKEAIQQKRLIDEVIADQHGDILAKRLKGHGLVQRVVDFVDQLANYAGVRTVRGIHRDIATGKIWEKTAKPEVGPGLAEGLPLPGEPGYKINTESPQYQVRQRNPQEETPKIIIAYRGDSVNPNKITSSKGGELGTGSYFSEDQFVAEAFTENSSPEHLKAYELQLKNPFNLMDRNLSENPHWKSMLKTVSNETSKKLLERWASNDLDVKNPYSFLARSFGKTLDTFNAFLAKHGFDGVISQGVSGLSDYGKQYVVFDSTQIKSATGNLGTFDPTNPDIRYQIKQRVTGADALRQEAERNRKLAEMGGVRSPIYTKRADELERMAGERDSELQSGMNYKVGENTNTLIPEPKVDIVANQPSQDIQQDIVRYQIRDISGGKDVDVPELTKAFLEGRKINKLLINTFKKKAKKSGVDDQFEVDYVSKFLMGTGDDRADTAISLYANGDIKADQLQTILAEIEKPGIQYSIKQRKPLVPEKPLEETGKELLKSTTGAFPKYAGSINLEKVGTSEDAKQLIHQAYAAYKGAIDKERRGVQSVADTRKLADELGLTEKKLLSKNPMAANAEYVTAARDVLATSARRLTDIRNKIGDNPSDEQLAGWLEAMNQHAMVQAEVSRLSTEAGRALRAHRETSQISKNYQALLDALGGRELTGEILKQFAKVDPTDLRQVNEFAKKYSEATNWDKFYEAWRALMLTSLKTHATNMAGNTLTFLFRPLETATAATVEAGRSLLPGQKRERLFGEAPAELVGAWTGIKEGSRAALSAWREQLPATELMKVEQMPAIKGKVGKYIRTSYRALGAEDAFFKALNSSASIYKLAYRNAKLEGNKSPSELSKRMGELIHNPTEEMTLSAKKAADYHTFNEALGPWMSILNRFKNNVTGLRYIIPFMRTPTNIAKYSLERTPLNMARIANKIRKGDLKGAEISDEMAKPILGSMIAAGVVALAAEGMITGGGPKNKGERERLLASGWQPYSLHAFGKYIPFNRLEPLGSIFGMAADFYELKKMDDPDAADFVNAIIGSVTKNLTSKTWVRSLSDAFDAVTDQGSWKSFVSGMAGSLVPGAVSATTSALEENRRVSTGPVERIMSRVPGAAQKLPVQRDIFGEPVKATGTMLERFVSPAPVTRESTDRLNVELARLGVRSPNPTPEGMTAEQYEKYATKVGRIVKPIITNIVNSGLSDLQKKNQIESIISEVKQIVKEQMGIEKKTPKSHRSYLPIQQTGVQ
jgi:hypothetical protein